MIIDGYRYRRHFNKREKTRWLCSQKNSGCKAYAWTAGGALLKNYYYHGHNHDRPQYLNYFTQTLHEDTWGPNNENLNN